MGKVQNAFASFSGLYPNTEVQIMKDRLFTYELLCLPWQYHPGEAHWMMKSYRSELGIEVGLEYQMKNPHAKAVSLILKVGCQQCKCLK